MSDFSTFTGKFRAHKDGSHESSLARVTKRPRESLACNQCRKSKLRCDRGQPCSSCVKRDDAAGCSYQHSAGSKVDSGRRVVAEDRLLHLESMVKQLIRSQVSAQSSNIVAPEKPVELPEIFHDLGETVDRARNEPIDNTRYVGYTHWSAILDDIHELKVLLGDSVELEEAEKPVAAEISALDSELIFGSSNNYSIQQIISQYLPEGVEIDRYLSIYFQGETFIIPWVHTYHFQRQYRDFWTEPAKVNPLWLSMLFSICYIASRIGEAVSSNSRLEHDSVIGNSIFHSAAGQCLVLGEYHRPQQFTVEALALYAQSKNFTSLDPSREAGAILGMVVRMAYEMGYHRDPDSFGSFTTFEGEMRRRFWAACKQMDLMISFQLGLPSNICLADCDTKSPRNLLDSDFDVDTQALPPSRTENEATRLLWFIVKDRQMVSFSKVCQDALAFREKSEGEIFQLDQEIREMHGTIPDVLRSRPLAQSITDPPFLIMTRIYVEFISLKSICVLHRRYTARGNVFSTRSCVEAGKKLVSQFIDMYKEFSPGGQLHTESWMLSNFTMNDFLLGVMVLCLVVYTRWKNSSQNLAIDTVTETEVLALLKQAHAICVEKSPFSRDARRVSHAVALTLNGFKSSKSLEDNVPQSLRASPTSFSILQAATGEAQGAGTDLLLLHSQHDHAQGDEGAFGILDPFNFLGHNIENMDWGVFDTGILDHGASYLENFSQM